MAGLVARFSLIDEMSSRLADIAESGQDMISKWEKAGATIRTAFDDVSDGSAKAVSSVDGVAYSIEDIRKELDAMGDGWEKELDAFNKARAGIMDFSTSAASLSDTIDDYSDVSGEAEKSLNELEKAQKEAENATEGFERSVSSGTTELDQFEAATDRARQAAEDFSAANNIASDSADALTAATENASTGTQQSGLSIEESIQGMATALATAGIVDKIKDIGVAVYDLADSFSEAEKTVIAQTGATGHELDKLMESSLDVFASSSAENLNDVAASMTTVQTATGLAGDALENATNAALTLENALGFEVSESTRAASALMKNFGLEAEEAYNIIAAGAQQGANQNGDLLDVLNEYSAQYAALGLSAEEFISSLVDGADAGVFSVDKVGDAVKEFNIRVKDASDTTTEAFEMLGMNADTMAARFAAGGETARTAFFEVVNALESMNDPMEKNAAAVSLFGTMYEDLEAGILPVLAGIEGGSIDTSNALSTMATEAQSLGDKWQQAGNSIQTAFATAVQPTIEDFSGGMADIVSSMGDFLNENPAVTKGITALGVGVGVVAVGITGVAFATKVAIPAVVSFGTAFNAALGPIGWVALGLTALTAAGTALVTMLSDASDETAGMTATTRDQYYELQNLTAEYERVCAESGEYSDEALELKYQVDTLSESFEANRQTVEEFTAEVDALCESTLQLSDDFDTAMGEITSQETGVLALVQRYEELATQADITGAQEEELAAITQKLAETYPELAGQFDGATMSAEEYVAAMERACEAQAEQQRQTELQETYTEALQKQAQLEDEIAKAEANLNAEREARGMYYDEQMKQWTNGGYTEDSLWASWTTDLDEYNDALEELNAAQAENEATLAEIRQEWEDIAVAEEATAGEADAVSTAYEGVRSRIEELCTAYDEAYRAALESFTGQFGLFDEASTSSEEYLNATVANAQAAMDSQLAYWDTYLSNVETLKATSAEDLGITQQNYEALMAYAQSGSEEAAGLAQSMVDAINSGNEEAVAELANTVGEVQAKQQEASAAVADWQTSFSETLSSLEQEMQAAVEGMDLSAKAQASAEATISSYIEQIRTSGGEASTAAESVAQQIEMALATQIDPEVDVDVNYEANTESLEAFEIPDKTAEATYELNSAEVDNYVMQDQTAEAEYLLNSAEVDAYAPEDKIADAIYDVNSYNVDTWNPPDKTATLTYNIQTSGSVPGHADGTTNAESAFIAGEEGPELIARRAAAYAGGTTNSTDYFIAGENGPELIVGEQGSTVFPAEETEKIISALTAEPETAAFPTMDIPALAEERKPLYVPLPLERSSAPASSNGKQVAQDRNIFVRIGGSDPIKVEGGGASKEAMLEILTNYLKPVLMNIIQGEIYEEGDLSYDY